MRRKPFYIYERSDWPRFRWDGAELAPALDAVRRRQARLLGRVEALGIDLRNQTKLDALTEDAVKTSEIEGEILERAQVRSSLARRLGMPGTFQSPVDKRADAIAAVVLDATQRFDEPLTTKRLFTWHATLFPDGARGNRPITVGAWRDDKLGPMQVVSGPLGRERIHFVAPPAERIPREMDHFLRWFSQDDQTIDPILKAAVAHIWFVTIHPFDDGNGRIGRAIADLALAKSEQTSQRFFSVSAMLRKERAAYYRTLEATQKGDLDLTDRLAWFIDVFNQALDCAQSALEATIRKSRLWQRLSSMSLNERQRVMLNKIFDGFEGKLTTSKWAKISKCSQDSALRDIEDLIRKGILAREAAGGRSTSYKLIDLAD